MLARLSLFELATTKFFFRGTPTLSKMAAADWEAMWTAGIKQGERFDISGSNKKLQELEAAGRVPTGRALVPGCGRGYDVAFLANAERHVVGLEYSETAANTARKYIADEHAGKVPYSTIVHGDFFAFKDEEGFDFIYDYTFFCAIPPERRGEWAKQMKNLLKKDGILMTLEFPLQPYPAGKPEHFHSGPPFQLKHEFYEAALIPQGFAAVEHSAVDPSLSNPQRAGKEAYTLWKRVH